MWTQGRFLRAVAEKAAPVSKFSNTHTHIEIYILSVCCRVLLSAHADPTYYMPRLVEQHSGPRALWEQWLSTYIASITAQLIDGLYGGCFQRGALPALQQEIKNALGVKRREILSRHTRQFVFPRGHPHISLHVLGGNLVFALVPGGLTSPSLALFFSFLFLFLKLWSVSPKLGANETTVLFLKAAFTSQVVLSKKQNKKQTNNTKCNLYKEAGC